MGKEVGFDGHFNHACAPLFGGFWEFHEIFLFDVSGGYEIILHDFIIAPNLAKLN